MSNLASFSHFLLAAVDCKRFLVTLEFKLTRITLKIEANLHF